MWGEIIGNSINDGRRHFGGRKIEGKGISCRVRDAKGTKESRTGAQEKRVSSGRLGYPRISAV